MQSSAVLNFCDFLGLARGATLGQLEEAWIKYFVNIPSCLSANFGAREQFETLIEARKTLRPPGSCKIYQMSWPWELLKDALKMGLIDKRWYRAFPRSMHQGQYPQNDISACETLDACEDSLMRCTRTRAMYDYELDFDPHPSAQQRATRRALHDSRASYSDEPERRLHDLYLGTIYMTRCYT